MNIKSTVYILSLIVLFTACSTKLLKPDSYSKEGFCVVNTEFQRNLGLKRFDTKEEFIKKCKGKMIFQFQENKCTLFTMKDMKFDIFIANGIDKSFFKIGEERKVCGKTIIESLF